MGEEREQHPQFVCGCTTSQHPFDVRRRGKLDAKNFMDDLCLEMMRTFNQERPIVFNTLQMYRHDRLEYLKEIEQHQRARWLSHRSEDRTRSLHGKRKATCPGKGDPLAHSAGQSRHGPGYLCIHQIAWIDMRWLQDRTTRKVRSYWPIC